MRHALKEIGNAERHTFTATVVRFGTKNGWNGPVRTILVKDVCLDGDAPRVVTSHLWFTVGKQIAKLALMSGDKIRFRARVKEYEKGYKGWRDDIWGKPIERDYCLSFPTGFEKVGNATKEEPQGRLL